MKAVETPEDSPGVNSAPKGKAKGKAKGTAKTKTKGKRGNERQWHLKTAQGPTVRLAMALSM